MASPSVEAWWKEAEDILTRFAAGVSGELVVSRIAAVGGRVDSFIVVFQSMLWSDVSKVWLGRGEP